MRFQPVSKSHFPLFNIGKMTSKRISIVVILTITIWCILLFFYPLVLPPSLATHINLPLESLHQPQPQQPSGNQAHVLGQWSPTFPLPLVPVAAAVLPLTGRVLLWAADGASMFSGTSNLDSTEWTILDPSELDVLSQSQTRTAASTQEVVLPEFHLQKTVTDHGMFCPGLSMSADGLPIVSGGSTSGRTSTYVDGAGWTKLANMTRGRGYQAQTTLGSGRIFTIGGSWNGGVGGEPSESGDGSVVPLKDGEIWDPETDAWTALPGCPVTPMLLSPESEGGAFVSDNHAWLFAWRNESVFQAGPSAQMNWYGVRGEGTHVSAGRRGYDQDSMNGNAIMYDAVAGKILTVGGAPGYADRAATRAAHIITLPPHHQDIDLDRSRTEDLKVKVEEIQPGMHSSRAYANSVVLPTGDVFINGGVTWAKQWTDINATLVPELWSPSTRQFARLARGPVPRSYHSVALLLPDATVLTGGGGLCWSMCEDETANHLDFNVFMPPYLFEAGGGLARRPGIVDHVLVQRADGGRGLVVRTDGPVERFSLVRFAAGTHSINTDQRRIPLDDVVRVGEGNRYQMSIPGDDGVAVPGYWMLFAIDAHGVPSVAKTIHIPVSASRN